MRTHKPLNQRLGKQDTNMKANANAWANVLPQTISNSFRHCGFTHTAAPGAEPDEDDIPLAELIRRAASNIASDELDAFSYAKS